MRGRRSQAGDTRVSPNGYHYTRTDEKWELTGRLIAAEQLGRPLDENERIRYLDGDRLNNDPNNIEVYVVKERSKAARRAQLEAKIDMLQAQLEALDED